MTKFEEIYAPATEPVTIANNANQALHKNHREWREAFHAVKVQNRELMDENKEFERENQRLKAENLSIKTLVEDAKQQPKVLQMNYCEPQQALPVVPEYVAEWIEHCKGMGYGLIAALTFKLSSTMHEELSAKILKWLGDEGNNDELFARAWLDGYTVEKPQLFYLRDELTGQFLAKDNRFKDKDKYFFWTGEDPLTHSIGTAWKLSFTQQEIDSMQTGSYEQIEVEK